MPLFNQGLFNTQAFGAAGGITGGSPASDLIYHALRLARVTMHADRIPSAAQYDDGMRALNRLIGTMNAQKANIFTIDNAQFLTSPGQQSYFLGPGGDWDALRPMRIERANILFPDDPSRVTHLTLLDYKQWASRSGTLVLESIPWAMYNDGASPVSQIRFWPTPDAVYAVELYSWQPIQKPIGIDDVLAYPDGYEEALVTNLACRLAAMWGKPVHPDVRTQAANALSAITSLNTESPRLNGNEVGSCYSSTAINYMGFGGGSGAQGPPGPPGPPGVAGPAVSAYMTGASPTFVAGVSTAVPFNATEFDTTGTNSMHSNSVSNTRVIAPTAGYYLVVGSHQFNSGATGTIAKLMVNGVDVIGSQTQAVITAFVASGVTAMVHLNAGDYVEYFITAVSADAPVFSYTDAPRAAARLQLIRLL